MLRVAIVLGTRPQIIKTATILRKLVRSKECEPFVIHTGQHYDYELSRVFFNEMKLPDPSVNLRIRAESQGRQTGLMMIGLERAMTRLKPDVVLVPGDTNSALAAALVAVKLKIPCAHLEAGPRTYDLSNPEEANRVVVDHLSAVAFAPTRSCVINLRKEGLENRRLLFAGDTMLDSFLEHSPPSSRRRRHHELGLGSGYVFTTIHRQENTDNMNRLAGIVRALALAKINFVFPIHPRTKRSLIRFRLWKKTLASRNVQLMNPLDYETTLEMASQAAIVLTDSGGLQKEAFWLGVPCVTVFNTTPWPETLQGNANRCVEAEPNAIATALLETHSARFNKRRSFQLFGGGKATAKVCSALLGMK
jgi:UDP-N-acetylglucosamine 2-epimerase (non-hydrolysing)